MTWLSPIAWSTWLPWALACVALATLAYLLKTRRQRFIVPFVGLWQRVVEERQAASWWHRLKRWISLLLALLLLCLLLLAMRGPIWGARGGARSIVLLVDTSASMRATDGDAAGRTRFAVLQDQLLRLTAEFRESDAVLVLAMDATTTPATQFVNDVAIIRRAITNLAATDAPADVSRGLRAARDALAGRANPTLIIATDGALTLPSVTWQAPAQDSSQATEHPMSGADQSAISLAGIDVFAVTSGGEAANVGIVAFSARRYPSNANAHEAFVELYNAGSTAQRRTITVFAGDTPIDARQVDLAAGERVRQVYPKLPALAERLRVELSPRDAFVTDDSALALIPPRPAQRILLVTRDSLFLEAALLAYAEMAPVVLEKRTPKEYAADPSLATRTDVVLFDDYVPTSLPPAPAHVMIFSADAASLPGARPLVRPRVTDITEHPVTRFAALGDVNFDDGLRLPVDAGRGDVVLFRSVRDAMAVARTESGRRLVWFGFALPAPHRQSATDLPLRVAFPLLIAGTLEWFAGTNTAYVAVHRTGQRQRIAVPQATDVSVTGPDGKRRILPVTDGWAELLPRHTGIYQLTMGEQVVQAVANVSSGEESMIAPQPLVLAEKPLTPPDLGRSSATRALWGPLVILFLALVALEWWWFHRRWTV